MTHQRTTSRLAFIARPEASRVARATAAVRLGIGAIGVLAPGRWADITVMDLDPLVVGASAPDELLRGSIRATIVAGKVAFAADTPGKGSK